MAKFGINGLEKITSPNVNSNYYVIGVSKVTENEIFKQMQFLRRIVNSIKIQQGEMFAGNKFVLVANHKFCALFSLLCANLSGKPSNLYNVNRFILTINGKNSICHSLSPRLN